MWKCRQHRICQEHLKLLELLAIEPNRIQSVYVNRVWVVLPGHALAADVLALAITEGIHELPESHCALGLKEDLVFVVVGGLDVEMFASVKMFFLCCCLAWNSFCIPTPEIPSCLRTY